MVNILDLGSRFFCFSFFFFAVCNDSVCFQRTLLQFLFDERYSSMVGRYKRNEWLTTRLKRENSRQDCFVFEQGAVVFDADFSAIKPNGRSRYFGSSRYFHDDEAISTVCCDSFDVVLYILSCLASC